MLQGGSIDPTAVDQMSLKEKLITLMFNVCSQDVTTLSFTQEGTFISAVIEPVTHEVELKLLHYLP